MPKALADGRTKLTFLETVPAGGIEEVTATLLNGGVDLSCLVLAAGYSFGPTGSETLNEKALCDEGNTTTFGASNYAALMTFFRYLTEAGKSEADLDAAWEVFTGKGVSGYLFERFGPKSKVPWATGDEVRFAAKVVTDDPQAPSERTGYVKFVQPFGIAGETAQRFALDAA